MIRYAMVLAVVACMALTGSAVAGEFNKKISIGDAAPVFKGLDGVDGKQHGLDDYKGKDVLVVVITCNHCPVAVAYEDRIIAFTKKHAGADSKVGVVAINVNNLDADKLDKMKERSKEKGFNFPYLYDPSQNIGKSLGASVTPEFFVYDKSRKLVYTGSMDNKQNGPTENFLEPAIEATLKGEKVKKAETKAFGCGVKYEK